MVSLFPRKRFFRKLDRLLTAIAYAEAGDLDAVKEILEQDGAPTGKRDNAAANVAPLGAASPVGSGAAGAKILEFKRAKPAF